ncbi:MAG: hypothetical protein ACI4SG_03070 [Oligosphaeraceae bacterium]
MKEKLFQQILTCSLVLILVFSLTGCTTMSRADKMHYAQLKAQGITIDRPVGNYEKPNSAVAAGALNLLPGFGNFYLAVGNGSDSAQAVYGVLNLLFWPISVIWAVPQGAIDATTLNKQELIYYYRFDAAGKEEMKKINFTFE